MKIWTIKEGEPLPIPECPGRIMRCGIISRMLSERGNEVTWWTSTYFHQTKVLLRQKGCIEKLSPNYFLHLLRPNILYKKNISIQRALYSMELSHLFYEAAKKEEKPDLIYCSFPLIDLAYKAVKYGKKNKVPVVIDIRDLWPDIFYQVVPSGLRWVARLLFSSAERKTIYCLKNADMVIGIVPNNIAWAYSKGRKKSDTDKVYYIGYEKNKYTEGEKKNATSYWSDMGLKNGDFIVCYFGTITKRIVDFKTVLDVATKTPQIKFVICGEGESLDELKQYYNLDNVHFPGYIDQCRIQALMSISSIGILPYKNTENFVNSITNKPFEYMSGALCIVTSIKGLLKNIVESNKCGYAYTSEQELEELLLMLYNNVEMLDKAKNNAYELYCKQFTAKRIYTSMCEQMENLARKHKN